MRTTLKNVFFVCLMIFIQTVVKAENGTGTTFTATNITVTGGGAMPSTTNGYNCGCDNTGNTDVTSCLQTALNTAASQGKPLLIPSGSYKISGQLSVNCSVIGTGSTMPTITQTSRTLYTSMFRCVNNMTGWIYNLHLVGTFNGSNGTEASQYNHIINLGGVNGVTIKGNILEKPEGDCITDNAQENDANSARNVLITNNSLLNPWRCCVSFNNLTDKWAIMNNYLTYYSNFVTPIDIEPYREAPNDAKSKNENIEIGYNNIQSSGTSGWAYYTAIVKLEGWFDPTPGGNVWVHHNFGSWGKPFYVVGPLKNTSTVYWTNYNFSNNEQGTTYPGGSSGSSVPTNLQSSNVAQTSFTLSWTASTDAVAYDVYKDGVKYGGIFSGSPPATSLNITGLTCGSTYSMVVYAMNSAGTWSAASAAKSVTTSSCGSTATNMLQNSGFESALSVGWTSDWGNSQLTSGEKYLGSYALKVGPSSGGRAQVLTSGFTVGATYTISAYAKLDASGSGASIGVVCKNSSGTRTGTYSSSDINIAYTWTKYTKTFTIPASTTTLEVHVWYNGGTASVFVDEFYMVAGSTAKSASVADEITEQAGEVKIYPNPLSGNMLNISTEGIEGDKSISIIDMSGRIILAQKLQDADNQSIDLSGEVSKGTYIVQISSITGVLSKLLIVQ